MAISLAQMLCFILWLVCTAASAETGPNAWIARVRFGDPGTTQTVTLKHQEHSPDTVDANITRSDALIPVASVNSSECRDRPECMNHPNPFRAPRMKVTGHSEGSAVLSRHS